MGVSSQLKKLEHPFNGKRQAKQSFQQIAFEVGSDNQLLTSLPICHAHFRPMNNFVSVSS